MVRKFDYSWESMKYLFCEVDFVIMLLKLEGFGLIFLEVLLVGLFILVSSRLGFVRVIESFFFGWLFIVDVDSLEYWVEKIEDVCFNYRVCFEEIKELKVFYGKKYSWMY